MMRIKPLVFIPSLLVFLLVLLGFTGLGRSRHSSPLTRNRAFDFERGGLCPKNENIDHFLDSLSDFDEKSPFGKWKGKIEYEDGVKVITNPQKPLFGEVVLELEEDLVLGSENDPNQMFYQWISVDTDQNGNIYVLDRGNFRIQKFDHNGKYIQTMGRKGQGPGEFEDPRSIKLDKEGNIYVKDGPKLHFFDQSGSYRKTFPVPLNMYQFTVTSEGKVLGDGISISAEKFSENIVLMNDAGRIEKTIASYSSLKMDAMFKQRSRFILYTPEISFSSGLDDFAVFGFPSEYRLIAVNSRGDILYIIKKDEPAKKISGKERRATIDEVMDTLKKRNPDKKESREELQKRTFIPKFRPFFEEIQIDEDGYIYANRVKIGPADKRGNEYDVFNKDGYYLYKLYIPVRLPQMKRGYVYTARPHPETGYFQVRRYKIKNCDPEKIH